MGRRACRGSQLLYTPSMPLLHYGLYSLESASVPVQSSYKPGRILISVHLSYNAIPPMGCTDNTEPLCLYSRATALPPKGLRNLESLSACTGQLNFYSVYGNYRVYKDSELVEYSYKINSPIFLTAFKKTQYLYNRALSVHPLWFIYILEFLQCLKSTYIPLFPYGL